MLGIRIRARLVERDLWPTGSPAERRAWARGHLTLTFLWFFLSGSLGFGAFAGLRWMNLAVGVAAGLFFGLAGAIAMVAVIRFGWTLGDRDGVTEGEKG